MGHQFIEFGDGMVGDSAKHIAEPGERIDLHEFTGGDEAAQYGRSLAALIAAKKRPVAATYGDAA
jgi:hypothetical protein